MRNKGNWQFEDVTEKANAGRGFAFRLQRRCGSMPTTMAGPMLYVPNEYGNGVLLVNQRATARSRNRHSRQGRATSARWALTAGDFDNDGNIDLYMANMYSKAESARVIGNLEAGHLRQGGHGQAEHLCHGQSALHRNLGGLEVRAEGQGLADQRCPGGPTRARQIDLDNDGWLDLYATAESFISRDRDETRWLKLRLGGCRVTADESGLEDRAPPAKWMRVSARVLVVQSVCDHREDGHNLSRLRAAAVPS